MKNPDRCKEREHSISPAAIAGRPNRSLSSDRLRSFNKTHHPSTSSIAFVLTALLFWLGGLGEAKSLSEHGGTGSKPGIQQFDPHDLSGIWVRTDPGSTGTVRGRFRTDWIGPASTMPPLTPEGMAKMNGRVGTNDLPLPVFSNDPKFKCNPSGFPRILYTSAYPFEFAQLDGRLLQLFQWERVLREVWMDGRVLPSGENLENLGPAWYGHSVGEWEGEALVVNTVGLDDRAWLDGQGHPLSLATRIEERWERIDANTLVVQLTLHDPTMYTAPWVGDRKIFARMPPEDATFFGWYGLFSGVWESICAPMNEVDDHTTRFMLPGSFGVDP